MIKNWPAEIRRVGFKDWFWFVFIIRRNEFSPRLALSRYWYGINTWQKQALKLVEDRQRADRIDTALRDVGNPYRCQQCWGKLAYVNAPCQRCGFGNCRKHWSENGGCNIFIGTTKCRPRKWIGVSNRDDQKGPANPQRR